MNLIKPYQSIIINQVHNSLKDTEYNRSQDLQKCFLGKTNHAFGKDLAMMLGSAFRLGILNIKIITICRHIKQAQRTHKEHDIDQTSIPKSVGWTSIKLDQSSYKLVTFSAPTQWQQGLLSMFNHIYKYAIIQGCISKSDDWIWHYNIKAYHVVYQS